MTPHIRDLPHIEALQLTLETAADHSLNQHLNQPRKPHTKIHHDPGNLTVLHVTVGNSPTAPGTQGNYQQLNWAWIAGVHAGVVTTERNHTYHLIYNIY